MSEVKARHLFPAAMRSFRRANDFTKLAQDAVGSGGETVLKKVADINSFRDRMIFKMKGEAIIRPKISPRQLDSPR